MVQNSGGRSARQAAVAAYRCTREHPVSFGTVTDFKAHNLHMVELREAIACHCNFMHSDVVPENVSVLW